MREDGTVLPRQLTGLCKKQQLRVERCVMQVRLVAIPFAFFIFHKAIYISLYE